MRVDFAEDIIEEALNLYRANVFAKSFDVRGPADRTLIYLFLFIGECLDRLKLDMSLVEAKRAMSLAGNTSPIALPGEEGFPLNGLFPTVAGTDVDKIRNYLSGLRSELVARLLMRLYGGENEKSPSIWWMAFQRRKFMNKSLCVF